MAFTFARCCHPAIRRAGGKKKKERRRMGPYKGARLATSLWFEDTAIFPRWQTSKQELFFFPLNARLWRKEGKEGGVRTRL